MAFVGEFRAKILCDSSHPEDVPKPVKRLVTMELTYPRCIHSEFMTHRMFSRNTASSRAIPIKTMLKRVEEYPFIPIVWGSNQKGMQAGSQVEETGECEYQWVYGLRLALIAARRLDALGLHKQIVNRVVEPWMWITCIATGVAGAWENFFKLRCHPDAEPHIQHIAYMARKVFDASDSMVLTKGTAHLPLTGLEDKGLSYLPNDILKKVSTARCARVSYLTHDGKRDIVLDLQLHDDLRDNGHWSPFEHVATPHIQQDGVDWVDNNRGGNFGPVWIQYRKTFTNEVCTERKAQ